VRGSAVNHRFSKRINCGVWWRSFRSAVHSLGQPIRALATIPSLSRSSDQRREHSRFADRHRGVGHPASAESARGIAPRAAHRSGRESLDSSGSCHPSKAAAWRQDREFLRFPVDSISPGVTCSLRSTGITPLLRYYIGSSAPLSVLRYFRPRGAPTCTFSLIITAQVLKFRTRKWAARYLEKIHVEECQALQRGQNESLHAQSPSVDVPQISRGKFDRLRCTAAGSTTGALDGNGLRRHWPLRPPP
jgi:hypothetical protein